MTKGNRKRTMTDEEIGLVKAMLKRGMKNDRIHFFFNRPDRLISSGRIAQIRKGTLGASVEEASSDALDAFLAAWEAQQRKSEPGPLAPTDGEVIVAMFEQRDGVAVLRSGETDRAECKQSFRLDHSDRSADAIKTIAGFANNKGGYLLFGVHDKTQALEGLSADYFEKTDPAEINRTLASALDPVPHVTKAMVTIDGKSIGVLYVEKHDYAPVIALKNIGSSFKEGMIYYRYVGETRVIKPGELRQIIANREQRAVAEFTRRMNKVAEGSAATLDLDTGEVTGNSGSFVIHKELLPNLQFIRQGDFSEVKGSPALRLIGDVELIDPIERAKAHIIRENVTPDAVTRNFLRNEKVADPLQYIQFQAHSPYKWLPVWYYVQLSGLTVEQVVEDLERRVATHPSVRACVVERLLSKTTARSLHVGKPKDWRVELAKGSKLEPKTLEDDRTYARAVQGLSIGKPDLEGIRATLLACLDRAQGEDETSRTRRGVIFRAAGRLDELLYGAGAKADKK